MQENFSYDAVLATSQRVAFRLDDVLASDASLDFGRPFLPERLASVRTLDFLSGDEQLCLNHIRAHAYLSTFGLVEEFILPFVLDHVRSVLADADSDTRTRALLQFAGEEAKHIELFRRFRAAFERGFGVSCETVGPPRAVADAVLSHGPLGVSLAILHIEWMTQAHYLEAVRGDEALDPLFGSLLKFHFIEECQHAKLDTLMTLEIAERLTPDEIDAGIDEYFEIAAALDGLLGKQLELDLASFERATGRLLSEAERDRFMASQRAAARFTYLGSGMRHPQFVATLSRLSVRGGPRLVETAARFV